MMKSKWQSFWRGFCSIFDISGVYHDNEIERILNTPDADALRSDWRAVGEDFEKVLNEQKKEDK